MENNANTSGQYSWAKAYKYLFKKLNRKEVMVRDQFDSDSDYVRWLKGLYRILQTIKRVVATELRNYGQTNFLSQEYEEPEDSEDSEE